MAPSRKLPLRMFERNGAYYCWYVDGTGKRRQKKLSRHLDAARKIQRKLEEDADLERAGLAGYSRLRQPWRNLVSDHVAHLKASRSKKHALDVERCLESLPFATVGDVTRDALRRMQDRLIADEFARATINKRVSYVMAAMQWAVDDGRLAMNPVARFKKLPLTDEHRRFKRMRLTAGQVAALLESARADDRRFSARVPQTPTIAFLVGTGARPREASAVRWADVELGPSPAVLLRGSTTKTRKSRVVPFSDDLRRELLDVRKVHGRFLGRLPGPQDPVILSPRGHRMRESHRIRFARLVRDVGFRAKLCDEEGRAKDGTRLDAYALRGTYVTLLAEAGVDMAHAAELAGHASIEITRRYYLEVGRLPLRDAAARLPRFVADSQQDADESSEVE